jgi:pimeloyl-ACP methyl ester carboxylesterase
VTTHRTPGLVTTDHALSVPLDHDRSDGERITVFAREVVAAERERDRLPWLLFLQGGPGGKSPRPTSPGVAAWLERALRRFRVLLLDQRGTGRSTPANRQTLATRGNAAAQAAYLAHFRADCIVRDAELFRHAVAGGEPWTVLGQSFGGFCTLTYLSFHPDGVREALIAGGLAPIDLDADDVYRATYRRVAERNAALFARYPEDQAIAAAVADHLERNHVRLPGGERLTARRFQTIGHQLGMAPGLENVHFQLEEAFVDGAAGPELSDTFLHAVDAQASYAGAPLYALVHEPSYCQGAASRWAAQRVRDELPEFSPGLGREFRFTGEMVYPWVFEEDPALVPLRGAAELLAAKDDWPALYDTGALEACSVPCAAAVYVDDMYVDYDASLATAAHIRGLRPWITNAHMHDGLRLDGAVFDRLLALARGGA